MPSDFYPLLTRPNTELHRKSSPTCTAKLNTVIHIQDLALLFYPQPVAIHRSPPGPAHALLCRRKPIRTLHWRSWKPGRWILIYQWCTDWIELFTHYWAAKNCGWNTIHYKSCYNLLPSTHIACARTHRQVQACSSFLNPVTRTASQLLLMYLYCFLSLNLSRKGKTLHILLNWWQVILQTKAIDFKQASFMFYSQK